MSLQFSNNAAPSLPSKPQLISTCLIIFLNLTYSFIKQDSATTDNCTSPLILNDSKTSFFGTSDEMLAIESPRTDVNTISLSPPIKQPFNETLKPSKRNSKKRSKRKSKSNSKSNSIKISSMEQLCHSNSVTTKQCTITHDHSYSKSVDTRNIDSYFNNYRNRGYSNTSISSDTDSLSPNITPYLSTSFSQPFITIPPMNIDCCSPPIIIDMHENIDNVRNRTLTVDSYQMKTKNTTKHISKSVSWMGDQSTPIENRNNNNLMVNHKYTKHTSTKTLDLNSILASLNKHNSNSNSNEMIRIVRKRLSSSPMTPTTPEPDVYPRLGLSASKTHKLTAKKYASSFQVCSRLHYTTDDDGGRNGSGVNDEYEPFNDNKFVHLDDDSEDGNLSFTMDITFDDIANESILVRRDTEDLEFDDMELPEENLRKAVVSGMKKQKKQTKKYRVKYRNVQKKTEICTFTI